MIGSLRNRRKKQKVSQNSFLFFPSPFDSFNRSFDFQSDWAKHDMWIYIYKYTLVKLRSHQGRNCWHESVFSLNINYRSPWATIIWGSFLSLRSPFHFSKLQLTHLGCFHCSPKKRGILLNGWYRSMVYLKEWTSLKCIEMPQPNKLLTKILNPLCFSINQNHCWLATCNLW